MHNTDIRFSVSQNYSEIPNLQQKSTDTYEVTQLHGNVQIEFFSTGKNGTISEKKIFDSLTFEEAKGLVLFLSENRIRETAWLEIIDDYCLR